MTDFMIYGATGYTGRIASEHAKHLGLRFIVAGRTTAAVTELASSLHAPSRVFDIDNNKQLDSHLAGIQILLNCAGPFMHTAEPFIRACIRNGVHYMDIAAELESYQLAEKHDEDARTAHVMLLPGCGGSVAMLGCLAGHIVGAVERPARIDIALHVAGSMSRGSAISAAENLTQICLQRQNGRLVEQDANDDATFDFDNGKGQVQCFPVTLPDLITIWKSTKVSNIRTFVHVSGDAYPTGPLDGLPDGPTPEQREKTPYDASVIVTAEDGSLRRAVLHTVNGYSFTPMASVEAVRRVLAGEVREGFQTPAGLFGHTFVQAVPGSSIKDL
ncbi:hypothetical protein S40293_08057 [Stachybotrys chartarum IBT 40293]|nr:hypothetical protein S40293_08057 [Stachybotrys chartarum IBT 40293]